MNKLLMTYSSFVLACLVVIAAFITATTYTQLAIAIILYPVLVFFAYKSLPRKTGKHSQKEVAIEIEAPVESDEKAEKVEILKSIGISDIDKRVFLKLIAGSGVVLFLLSIFNRKAEGLFFKNLPGQVSGSVSLEDIEGNKINPAQDYPMDGYGVSEIDDDIVSFYGYTNKLGAWYVLKIDTDTGSFRYSKGENNFPKSWSNRKNLNYDYYNNIF